MVTVVPAMELQMVFKLQDRVEPGLTAEELSYLIFRLNWALKYLVMPLLRKIQK